MISTIRCNAMGKTKLGPITMLLDKLLKWAPVLNSQHYLALELAPNLNGWDKTLHFVILHSLSYNKHPRLPNPYSTEYIYGLPKRNVFCCFFFAFSPKKNRLWQFHIFYMKCNCSFQMLIWIIRYHLEPLGCLGTIWHHLRPLGQFWTMLYHLIIF